MRLRSRSMVLNCATSSATDPMISTSAIRPVDRVFEHAEDAVGEALPFLFVFFVFALGLGHWATLRQL